MYAASDCGCEFAWLSSSPNISPDCVGGVGVGVDVGGAGVDAGETDCEYFLKLNFMIYLNRDLIGALNTSCKPWPSPTSPPNDVTVSEAAICLTWSLL